ncbi:DUF6941 family protein [Stenotrophomonas oahuensis]|uniref:Uncharacterized protein n=1 Tax=Stenotrophomonas oahuensis TaxID=3003271 RepID=A0ABY9YNV0_9GAMM|nr:hypothetical protein [Stenotrophomonas sp. A5586]WNH52584.1 hypothetical protein PDM29_20060 [Stenotrophomonas sp. A5586]
MPDEVIGSSGVPVVRARAAHAIFCDDLRHEDSGKLLIIGMYGEEMGVPAFPLQLPVFTILVSASTPADEPFKSLEVKVYFGEEEIASRAAPPEAIAQLSAASAESAMPLMAPSPRGGYVTNRWRVNVQLAPFVVSRPGVLRVRVVTESEEIPAGGLRIRQLEVSPSHG